MKSLMLVLCGAVLVNSANTYAIGDREQNVLAAIGGVYLLNELIGNKKPQQNQMPPPPNYRMPPPEVNGSPNFDRHHDYHRQQYVQPSQRTYYPDTSYQSCNDAVSCAYQQGFSDGIKRRAPNRQYCNYYGGC